MVQSALRARIYLGDRLSNIVENKQNMSGALFSQLESWPSSYMNEMMTIYKTCTIFFATCSTTSTAARSTTPVLDIPAAKSPLSANAELARLVRFRDGVGALAVGRQA